MGLGGLFGNGGERTNQDGSRYRVGERNLDTTGIPDPNPMGYRPRPPGAPTVGKAVTREELANLQLEATNPPRTAAEESRNQVDARIAAQRQRRRATAGSAGRVSTGNTGAQRSYNAARRLIGS